VNSQVSYRVDRRDNTVAAQGAEDGERTVVHERQCDQSTHLSLGTGLGKLAAQRGRSGAQRGTPRISREVVTRTQRLPGDTMTLTPDDVRNAAFRRPRRFQSGYDEREVDLFLDRVEKALRGRDSLTADDVLAVTFASQRRKRAYNEDDVDTFLDEIARTLMRQAPNRPQVPARMPDRTTDRIPDRSTPSRQPAEPVPQPAPMGGHNIALAPPGQPAYDEEEVDAFIARVEATMRGEDTLTAQDVLAARFNPPQPGRNGYHEAGVTAFLVLVATSLKQLAVRTPEALTHNGATRTLTPQDIHDVVLRSAPPDRWGYDEREVDAFLDRVEATLRGSGTLTPQDVRDVRFSAIPPGRGGYHEEEVENLLDLVEAQLDNAALAPKAFTEAQSPYVRGGIIDWWGMSEREDIGMATRVRSVNRGP
jgi:DivIVA domain-containing protein